ncbi:alpha-1,2-mannosidase [Kutzneria sp. CA-103260]|nr:alpha-1,2-mannosidase [Kutzneria sp. CA-103260]
MELLDTTVHGAATIAGTAQDVTIAGGAIAGALTLSGNHTGSRQPEVAGISVSGTLPCAGNAPAPSNIAAPNTVRGGSVGQCSAL